MAEPIRILHALHDFLPRHRAGSEIYVHHLCRELARRHHVHVLAAEYDPARPDGSLAWRVVDGIPVTELVNNWRFASFEETYRSPFIGHRLVQVLQAVQPDVVHVHNLLNLSMDLPRLARQAGIPTVATLHDHGLVCPSGGQRLHQAERHVCATVEPERCARCFAQSPWHQQMAFGALAGSTAPFLAGPARRLVAALPRAAAVARRAAAGVPASRVSASAIDRRLARARELYAEVDLFVAPSEAMAAAYAEMGMPRDRLQVMDYGFPPLPVVPRPARGERLAVGFVGTLVWHKGVHLLLEALAELPRDRIELRIFGDTATFPDYVAALRDRAASLPVTFAGRVEGEELARAYASMDALVVPSLWPENSPLVIHEAFQAGVPVVGARMGGIPELVRDAVSGLLFDPWKPGDLARCLSRLLHEPGLAARLGKGVPAVRTIEEDAAAWAEIYRSVLHY